MTLLPQTLTQLRSCELFQGRAVPEPSLYSQDPARRLYVAGMLLTE